MIEMDFGQTIETNLIGEYSFNLQPMTLIGRDPTLVSEGIKAYLSQSEQNKRTIIDDTVIPASIREVLKIRPENS